MTLEKYWESLDKPQRDRFVKRANTSHAYIYQLIAGIRNPGVKSVVNISKASRGEVTQAYLIKMSDRKLKPRTKKAKSA